MNARLVASLLTLVSVKSVKSDTLVLNLVPPSVNLVVVVNNLSLTARTASCVLLVNSPQSLVHANNVLCIPILLPLGLALVLLVEKDWK